ncbi:MAG: Na/Pi cotransporter family protein [Spirochaetaceae bacterium]|nr:Na/Pi cotransporter family protein [Spirochaetaceae bacterium]
MAIIESVLRVAGSLCLFLYGLKVMSDGIQQGAGSRLQGVLGYMTGRRLSAVLTGFAVTAIIQSSSATTVMVVSFVNAGILTLTQAVGVIMGANIGTTVTAWVVSILGFTLNISTLALPAVATGFVLGAAKWRHREIGNMIMGFGLLFLGLDFLTRSMPQIAVSDLGFLRNTAGSGTVNMLAGLAIGLVITVLMHSSSASTAIVLTMVHNGVIDLRFGAAMILGANIGTTIDAMLASIGTKTAAKRAALVHVLFNCIGSIWAMLLLDPLIHLVDIITPGNIDGAVTAHMAMFHTAFNLLNTMLFFPFVGPLAKFVSLIIKDSGSGAVKNEPYRFSYITSMRDPPELSILYAEKEIRDMAELALSMYVRLRKSLTSLSEGDITELLSELGKKEACADQMREEITRFLLECTRRQLNIHSQRNISLLIRIIADIEDLTDDCYAIGFLLERSVRKNQIFNHDEMEALGPYMGMVEEFLSFVSGHLGGKLDAAQSAYAKKIEADIDASRDKLRKLGRKRIEAGANVKTELLFIDLVRRVERLGDYCYSISALLAIMEEA